MRAGRWGNEAETTILEDDVLVPAAGILDVWTMRVRADLGDLPVPRTFTSSFDGAEVPARRGDAVVGQVGQRRQGERREKFNPMVRIDSINGTEAEGAEERPDFAHSFRCTRTSACAWPPTSRPDRPGDPHRRALGKGERGLVRDPTADCTTTLVRSIAQSVTRQQLRVPRDGGAGRHAPGGGHRLPALGQGRGRRLDLRPAAGRPHAVAELAIERAKRLVELGHDVVVLLDSLTRLGRAYNLAAPANGRVLGGLVDASAVHPTKEFFGAARKIEDAGSLTILATVSVGTGSATDEFFLEELAGTANLELVLSAERAAQGIVPAVDVAASGTRHEEKLLAPAEGAVVGDLRKQLAAADARRRVGKVIGSR